MVEQPYSGLNQELFLNNPKEEARYYRELAGDAAKYHHRALVSRGLDNRACYYRAFDCGCKLFFMSTFSFFLSSGPLFSGTVEASSTIRFRVCDINSARFTTS